MSGSASFSIRTFAPEDIPFGMELKNAAGWNQLPMDWERFIEWQPDGCFLATYEGQPAGTATTINYDSLFGWVGMVLVHDQMRRKGIGTGLLMACIEYLEDAGVAAVKLDATPMGKNLYDTIGFFDEYLIERHQVSATTQESQAGVETLTADLLPDVCELDARAFGADRSRVLRRLQSEVGTDCFVALDGSSVLGHIFVRPGMNADHIGPWVAAEPDAAVALLKTALNARAGKTLFIDISLANENAAEIIAAHGFEKQRHLIRMYRGENTSPGDTNLVYSITGPEIG